MAKGEHYLIKIKGRLGPHWSDRFGGLAIANERGETTIAGQLVDQTALHGLLIRIRDLGLPLLLVKRIEPMPTGERAEPGTGHGPDPIPTRQRPD